MRGSLPLASGGPGVTTGSREGQGTALGVPTGEHLPALDGVRGIAILLVLLAHFSWGVPATAVDRVVAAVQAAGWMGVDLFFVLSGFLITGILLDTRSAPARFRRFYTRRVLRIFPLYYAALVFLLFVVPLLSPGTAAQLEYVREHQAWYWAYLNNVLSSIAPPGAIPLLVMHLWSLAVEEQFYLAWPAVVFLAPQRLLPVACAALFVLSVGIGMSWWVLWPDRIVGPGAALAHYARAGGLVLGALVAIVLRGPHASRMLAAARPVALGAAAVVLLIALDAGGLDWSPLVLSVGVPALQLAFAGLVIEAWRSRAGTPLGSLLRSRVLVTAGKYSYGIYVVHTAAVALARRLVLEPNAELLARIGYLPAQALTWLIAGVVTMAIALASWHLLEKRFLALKDRLAPRPERAAVLA